MATRQQPLILVVEDDPDLLSLVTKKLELEGFSVTQTISGRQALDYLKQHRPALIVLDILLPDIDGITVLTELAGDSEAKTIPVIVFSNLGEQGSFEQVKAIGDYDYLVKSTTDLHRLIRHIRAKLGIA